RRRLGREWGLLAALMFVSTPAVLRLATSAYVDLGLTFFFTAAVSALFLWAEKGRTGFLVLSAAAFGLALGTKYSALVGLPLLGAGVVLAAVRKGAGPGRALLEGALFAAVALLVFSPWAVWNWLETGNPVYPLANSFFGLPPLDAPGHGLGVFGVRRLYYGESLWKVLLTPVRAFFVGRDYSGQYFDGVLNPFLLLLPPLAFIRLREATPGQVRLGEATPGQVRLGEATPGQVRLREATPGQVRLREATPGQVRFRDSTPGQVRPSFPETGPLAALAGLWILLVFFKQHFIIRYVAPVLPFLVIVSVYGLYRIAHGFRRRAALALAGALILMALGYNAWYAYDHWRRLDPVSYLSGREDREAFLGRRLGYYPTASYVRGHTPPDAKVLLLFVGGQSYYFDRVCYFNLTQPGRPLLEVLEKSGTVAEVAGQVRKFGVTYLAVREEAMWKYIKDFLPDKTGLWRGFLEDRTRKLFTARGYSVYVLGP
ncbi:MAG: glycosyltransferase family 39 protein, partial [Thermodesulfobacteriota bacterium]